MTDHESLTELPSFFAPGAFALARTGHSGIAYDVDQLGAAADFMRQEADVDLPEDPTQASFVYRFGEGGFERPEPDPNFPRANPSTLYIPAGQLALGTQMAPATITKADILALSRPVVQVQMSGDTSIPLIGAMAGSLLYNPAEDHRMAAGPAAWVRQIQIALHIGAPGEGTNKRVVSEAASRFAGAIVLLPRRSASRA